MNMRLVRSLLSLAAVALAAGPALAAAAPQIDARGPLHRVEAVWSGKPAMPVLRHSLVRPDGTTASSVVPGTDDLFMDTDPALAVDPTRGTLVLAWSRDTGGGYAVYVSRYGGSSWSTPVQVLDEPFGEEIDPQIQITPSLVHVVAHSGLAYKRICLDPVSLQPVFGPEPLWNGGIAITPGVDPATATPTDGHVFFTSNVIPPTETDPGRVVIWGVRDEPVPIDYLEALALPADTLDAAPTAATPIEGSLTVTVDSGTHVWYTVFQNGAWSASASVVLDGDTTLNDVRSMLADMIRRSEP